MKRMTTKSDDEVPENVKIGSNDMLTIMQSAEKNNKRKSFFSEMHTTAKVKQIYLLISFSYTKKFYDN